MGSAGFSGYGTVQHLEFVACSPVVDEVDCLIFLVGAEDYLRAALGHDIATATPLLRRLLLYRMLTERSRRPQVVVDREGKEYSEGLVRLAFRLQVEA